VPDPVVGRRVEVADPAVPRRAQRICGGVVVQRREQPAERPAAEAELGDLDRAVPEPVPPHYADLAVKAAFQVARRRPEIDSS
jgi:hypothetical protein